MWLSTIEFLLVTYLGELIILHKSDQPPWRTANFLVDLGQACSLSSLWRAMHEWPHSHHCASNISKSQPFTPGLVSNQKEIMIKR